ERDAVALEAAAVVGALQIGVASGQIERALLLQGGGAHNSTSSRAMYAPLSSCISVARPRCCSHSNASAMGACASSMLATGALFSPSTRYIGPSYSSVTRQWHSNCAAIVASAISI